jgi:RNA polymerase primary sigma factor
MSEKTNTQDDLLKTENFTLPEQEMYQVQPKEYLVEAEKKRKLKTTSEGNGHHLAEIDSFADLSDILPDDILSLYLKEMVRTPLLSYEQELSLAKELEKGRQAQNKLGTVSPDTQEAQILKDHIKKGEQARDQLIRANTRLVVSVAKKYRNQGVPFTDLIQEGNLGLMKATTKFDYRRGYRFSTYATWWIRQAVTRAVANQGRTIRIPLFMNDRFRKLQQVSEQLEQSWGRKPTPEEVAGEMNMDPARVRWMFKASQHSVSLEAPVGEEGDTALGDFIEDKGTPPPADATNLHLLREELNMVISTLPPRESKILKLRFGLQNCRAYSLQEIGQKFGLTRERIRQLEKNALRRLRHPRRSRPLKDFLD